MFKRFQNLFLSAVLVSACTVSAFGRDVAASPSPARDMWMDGFLKYKEGVVAEKGANAALALRLYQEAAATFGKVRSDYPDWQPSVVSFRINECMNRIKVLNTQLSERESDLSKDELLTLNQSLKAQVADLEEKAMAAQEKVEILTAKAENAATGTGGADAAALNERIAALERENRALLDKSAEVPAHDDKQVAKLKAREKELVEENKSLRDALKGADQAKKLAGEVEALKGIAVDLESSLAAMSEEKTALRKELASALTERKALADALAKLSKRLEELQAASERLRKQNDALREQL